MYLINIIFKFVEIVEFNLTKSHALNFYVIKCAIRWLKRFGWVSLLGYIIHCAVLQKWVTKSGTFLSTYYYMIPVIGVSIIIHILDFVGFVLFFYYINAEFYIDFIEFIDLFDNFSLVILTDLLHQKDYLLFLVYADITNYMGPFEQSVKLGDLGFFLSLMRNISLNVLIAYLLIHFFIGLFNVVHDYVYVTEISFIIKGLLVFLLFIIIKSSLIFKIVVLQIILSRVLIK